MNRRRRIFYSVVLGLVSILCATAFATVLLHGNFAFGFATFLFALAFFSAAVGMLVGHAATIGGPEHRDPTDKEIKDIRKKLAARNCYCSEYIGDAQCKESLTADEVATRMKRMDDYMDRSGEGQK